MNPLANLGDAFEAYLKRQAERNKNNSSQSRQIQTLIGACCFPFNKIPVSICPSTDMACDPQLPEPDLSINLEVCDLINQTKKNA